MDHPPINNLSNSDTHQQRLTEPSSPIPAHRLIIRASLTNDNGSAFSLIEGLPFDVLLEVFGYLEPRDLLMFARLNRDFREHLMSWNARNVWQYARQNTKPVCLGPLAWCSEPKWADLLSCGRRCQTCGTERQNWPDFSLGRRMCTPCAQKNLIAKGRFGKIFPGCDAMVLEVIPFTNIGPNNKPTNTRFYWRQDIRDAAAKMTQLENDIVSGKNGARRAQDEWIEKRRAIAPAQDYLKECEKWLDNYMKQLVLQKGRQTMKQTQLWANEFINIGYCDEDIYAMIGHNKTPELHYTAVTDAARAKYEPLVIKERARRLAICFTANLESTYNAWFRGQPPQSWFHLPSFRLLSIYRPVVDILKIAEINTDEPHSDYFAYLVGQFPGIRDGWRTERLAYLRGLIGAEAGDGSRPINEELAVFKCTSCVGVLFGVEEAAIHSLKPRCLETLEYRFRQSMYIAQLIQLINRDPLDAKPLDLDLLDRRFRCLRCVGRSGASWQAFTWRQIVEHAGTPSDHPPKLVTNQDDIEIIRVRESKRMSPQTWMCAHCPEHWDHYVTLERVVDHNKQRHNVANPAEPVDFLWAYTYPRAKAGYAVEVSMREDHLHP